MIIANIYKTEPLKRNMKKRILGILIFAVLLQFVAIASAADTCDLTATLLNQDPHPAIPGEAVKVVFQIDGVSDPDCGDVEITLIESFPFALDKGYDASVVVQSGTYVRGFGSFLLVPYKLVIDEDALEGMNKLELDVSSSSGATITYSFDIEVEDLRTDFEVSVKDYDPKTSILTFQILNIGENDIEALTIDIPAQDFLEIKGSSRNIVGSLDSNDDTTFSFEAKPKDGDFRLIITYTDAINKRRTLEKTVSFDSSNFDGRVRDGEGLSIWFYITIIIVLVLIYRWYRGRKRRKHLGH